MRAVGDGVVDFAGWQNGYGNVIEIRHNAQRSTVYAHLSRIDVRRGEHVEQGERIGAVGMTGWATGPHLHFEVRIAGVQQDPLQHRQVLRDARARRRREGALRAARQQLKQQLQVAQTIARNGDSYGE